MITTSLAALPSISNLASLICVFPGGLLRFCGWLSFGCRLASGARLSAIWYLGSSEKLFWDVTWEQENARYFCLPEFTRHVRASVVRWLWVGWFSFFFLDVASGPPFEMNSPLWNHWQFPLYYNYNHLRWFCLKMVGGWIPFFILPLGLTHLLRTIAIFKSCVPDLMIAFSLVDLDVHFTYRLSLIMFHYLWSSVSFFHVIKRLLFGTSTFYSFFVNLDWAVLSCAERTHR